MRTYAGTRGANRQHTVTVTEGGIRTLLPARRDLADHSQTGFGWGRSGQGPAQLALALLADAGGWVDAVELHYAFYEEVVMRLPESWILTSNEIMAWYCKKTTRIPECNAAG